MENRRKFLKLAGLTSLSTLVAAKTALGAIADCDYKETPPQTEGPFYPRRLPLDKDVDLTRIGNGRRAQGEVVIVTGVVTDDYCRPVEGAIVEIWQACHTGRYNHPADTSGTPLDPNFQYYGTMKTNAKGEYSFKTIRPGAYQASRSWRRPPHIHFKVNLRGFHELITQMYFENDPLNRRDQILQNLSRDDQKKVVVPFRQKLVRGEKVMLGRFDITLKRI